MIKKAWWIIKCDNYLSLKIKSKHVKLNGIGQVDIKKYPVYRKTAVLFELRNVGLKEENITIKDWRSIKIYLKRIKSYH